MSLDERLNRWWTNPEPNAAGRLGLIRILYAFGLLAFLIPPSTFPELSRMPANLWYPVPLLIGFSAPPPAWSLHLIEGLWIASLIMLLFGFYTRTMTFIALISGILTTAVSFSFSKIDHGGTFLYVFSPAVMLFSNWGHTYSVDALLRKTPPPLNSESGLRYSWPLKALLIILAVMFMMSGVLKGILGQWIIDPEVLTKFLKEANIAKPTQFRYDIYQIALIPFVLQWATLLFETLFPLALLSFVWRRFFLASAVFFHTGVRIMMGISFTGMFHLYVIYLDFQAILNHILPARMLQPLPRPIPRRVQWTAVIITLSVTSLALVAHYNWDVYNATFAIITRPYGYIMRYIWEIAIVIASITMLNVFLKVWGNVQSWKNQQKGKPDIQSTQALAEKTA